MLVGMLYRFRVISLCNNYTFTHIVHAVPNSLPGTVSECAKKFDSRSRRMLTTRMLVCCYCQVGAPFIRHMSPTTKRTLSGCSLLSCQPWFMVKLCIVKLVVCVYVLLFVNVLKKSSEAYKQLWSRAIHCSGQQRKQHIIYDC